MAFYTHLKDYKEEINTIIETLNSGGIILYPTDTIWGLGCDATNEKAVSRIYEIKKRISSKSMIILSDKIENIEKISQKVPEKAKKIISEKTNPLTIIYQNAKNIANNLIAEDGTVAIRIPDDDFCLNLITEFGRPIVSTSANISNEKSPANFSEISSEIKNQVDYVAKWRQNDNSKSKPSTIIKIKINNEITIIRE